MKTTEITAREVSDLIKIHNEATGLEAGIALVALALASQNQPSLRAHVAGLETVIAGQMRAIRGMIGRAGIQVSEADDRTIHLREPLIFQGTVGEGALPETDLEIMARTGFEVLAGKHGPVFADGDHHTARERLSQKPVTEVKKPVTGRLSGGK